MALASFLLWEAQPRAKKVAYRQYGARCCSWLLIWNGCCATFYGNGRSYQLGLLAYIALSAFGSLMTISSTANEAPAVLHGDMKAPENVAWIVEKVMMGLMAVLTLVGAPAACVPLDLAHGSMHKTLFT